MMTLKDIFERFDQIGCCAFSTIDDDGAPVSRIAHFIAVDDEGLYLSTMRVKPYYRQLKKHGTLSVCGDSTGGAVELDQDLLPRFQPGFTMRVTGQVRELDKGVVLDKAKDNPLFSGVVHDFEAYPETVVFVMYRGHGECYDYDFERARRDHKLERERFAFGGDTFVEPGLVIGDECIGCGSCFDTCTFDAITPGEPYRIDGGRCDECGNCYHVCPAEAVHIRGME
jgi:ferredoxin